MDADMDIKRFHPVDYVVFSLLFPISLAIGIYHALTGGRQKTTSEYFLGSRQLGLIPVTLSIIVSIVSTVSLLGVSTQAYQFGPGYICTVISLFLAGGFVTWVIIPLLYPLNLTSVHKYLEIRFQSKSVRWLGTFLFLATQIPYVGTVILGPAVSFEAVTGLPVWASIFLVSLIGTAYTTIGGMKAVVWTDVFQSVIMLVGILAIIIQALVDLGGWNEMWTLNADSERLYINTNFDLTTRLTSYNMIIGIFFMSVGFLGVNQPMVQRFISLGTLSKGRISLLLSTFGVGIFHALCLLLGMAAFAYYTHKGCDPIRGGYLKNPNQIIPYFALDILRVPGMCGLFVASLFCGSLSTISSSLNSMAAVLWDDILQEYFIKFTESKKTLIAKIIAALFGCLGMCCAYFFQHTSSNILQICLSLLNVTMGPLFGIFALGFAVPWADVKGALTGGILGFLFPLWLLIGQTSIHLTREMLPSTTTNCTSNVNQVNATIEYITQNSTKEQMSVEVDLGDSHGSGLKDLYSVSSMWYSLFGFLIVIVIGSLISLLPGLKSEEPVNPECLLKVLRRGKYSVQKYEKVMALQDVSDSSKIRL